MKKFLSVLALFALLLAGIAYAGFEPREVCDGADNDGDGLIDEDGVCQHMPEFSTMGAGLVLVGSGLYIHYKRKKR